MRSQNRKLNELRPLTFERGYTGQAPGSVLVRMGRTTVLCTCCIEESVPPFRKDTGKGWLTAEYSMLPGSTGGRKQRDRGVKVDGRTVEIQRLIGRSLRTVVNLDELGERALWMDCDVLEADGGTRTASINGAFVALIDALTTIVPNRDSLRNLLADNVAAVSVGLVPVRALQENESTEVVSLLDLEYREDFAASVDLNLIMTGGGQIVEVQAGGEEATFSREQLDELLDLGRQGIEAIASAQREALGENWPLD